MSDKLFSSNEDFFASMDEGMKLVSMPQAPPHKDDLGDLKSLLAVFITATIQMDPQAMADPELNTKLAGVRMALLAAYNLGRQREMENSGV